MFYRPSSLSLSLSLMFRLPNLVLRQQIAFRNATLLKDLNIALDGNCCNITKTDDDGNYKVL